LVIVEGGAVALVLARILRIRELEEFYELFASRIKKKLLRSSK
jgi:hypothetical protein